MPYQIGQRIYLEKHEMFPGYPKDQGFRPNNVSIMDGPSYVHYGEIIDVDEKGVGKLKITTKIDANGNEIPFQPEVPGYSEFSRLQPDGWGYYTSKETCQKYCDERNKTQMNHWSFMRATAPEKQAEIDEVVEKIFTDSRLTLTDEDLAGLESDEKDVTL